MNTEQKKLIYAIAQELDCGMDCYYNVKTQEFISIPGEGYDMSMDFEMEEFFEEDLERVKEQEEDFIFIKAPDLQTSFGIMESFVDQIDDSRFSTQLQTLLQNKYPFRNFKAKVEGSAYRQAWFDHKQKALESLVAETLNFN
ncbi:UPF0158 family protein [Mesonia sp. HuA40]|uniref:UPF0158 family protein n=1 Tax=Mesonia sp. HuA40 TaxID=2602761 RepID=UPI0011CAAADF|nr:UPF0158 family protein [Mesonia sp. HuA40]TXK70627.1 hypothetical protein FT993_11680 [Mesonia sp. HuA40]